jgi:hypothetical protein
MCVAAAKRIHMEKELRGTYVMLVTGDYAARRAEKHLREAQKVSLSLVLVLLSMSLVAAVF